MKMETGKRVEYEMPNTLLETREFIYMENSMICIEKYANY